MSDTRGESQGRLLAVGPGERRGSKNNLSRVSALLAGGRAPRWPVDGSTVVS